MAGTAGTRSRQYELFFDGLACAGFSGSGEGRLMRRTAMKRTARDTGPSRKVRALVLERDRSRCVSCGRYIGDGYTWWSLQHRKARGVGGDNSPCNLIVLCGSATSQGCHRLREDRDREMHDRGLWLRSDEDPATVPVMIASEHSSGVTAWLTDMGGYVYESPAGVVA